MMSSGKLRQAAKQFAASTVRAAQPLRWAVQVRTTTNRETTGLVGVERVGTGGERILVQVRNSVYLADNDLIWIVKDSGAQGNWIFDGFVEGAGTGESLNNSPIPSVATPVLTSPDGTPLIIRPVAGQAATIGRINETIAFPGAITVAQGITFSALGAGIVQSSAGGVLSSDYTIDATTTWATTTNILPTDASGQDLGDGTHRWDLYTQDVIFGGASGANVIVVPDNFADALHLSDAGGLEYLRVISTNANPYLALFPAGGGKVGIGTAAPGVPLDVTGIVRTSTYYQFSANAVNPGDATASLYNQAGVGPTFSGFQFEMRTGVAPAMAMRLTSVGALGVGVIPLGKMHVDQSAAGGAIPVAIFDQGDVSEQHIVCTMSGADVDFPAILQLAVTGTPTLGWDESEDEFTLSKGLQMTGGDLVFVNAGSGLSYAEIYAHEVAVDLGLAAQDTWYQIVAFDTDGESNNCTPDHTNDHITIVETGDYLVSLTWSGHSHNQDDYQIMVRAEGGTVAYTNVTIHTTTAVAGRIITSAAVGVCALSATDTVEAWALRTTGAAVGQTLTTDHITLAVVQVGG